MSDDTQQQAISVIIQKFNEQIKLWHAAKRDCDQLTALVAEAQARMEAANEKINECYRSAKLFEFDLNIEWNRYFELQKELWETKHNTQVAAPEAAPVLPSAAPKTIREHVIDAAKQAYPSPIRASGLRRELEVKGIKIHEKTVGMTLYRLSRRGILRRDGWDWFFIPEAERQTPAREEESPGSDPGLLLSAAE